MTEDLTKKLINDYPKIFPSGMEFGCFDGWYNIIDALCATMQHVIDNERHPQIIAVQIKEKFGSLRFYFTTVGENKTEWSMTDLTTMAMRLSLNTCERCGAPGAKMIQKGWEKVRCEKHKNQ